MELLLERDPAAVAGHNARRGDLRGCALALEKLSEGVYEAPRLTSRRSIVVPAAAQIMASLVAVSAS